MIFEGISRDFSLENDGQYDSIGAFWDELTEIYGLESLIGLGYRWERGIISYAIGLKQGRIEGANFTASLPDVGWERAVGLTYALPELYREIYRGGRLTYELEEFYGDGHCEVRYIRL